MDAPQARSVGGLLPFKNDMRRERSRIAFVAAVLLGTICSQPMLAHAQSVGLVHFNNTTSSEVVVELDHWVTGTGRTVTNSVEWTLKPGASVDLLYDDEEIFAAKFGYRLRTAAGVTPRTAKNYWINAHKGSGKFVIQINDQMIITRVAARRPATDTKSIARRFLEDNSRSKSILAFAHPTANFSKMEYFRSGGVNRDGRTVPGAFYLEYRFHWNSGLNGDRHSTNLSFFFDRNGRINEVRSDGTTSPFQPFVGTDLFLEVCKEAAREEMRTDPDLRNNRFATTIYNQILNATNAKSILEGMLKLAQL